MQINISGIDKVIGSFDKYVRYNRQATKFAMNQIARKASTQSLRKTNQAWSGIKASDLKKTVKITPATNSNLNYKWYMESSPIGLEKFSAVYRGTTTSTGKKRSSSKVGVAYKLKTKKRTLAKSFIKKSKFGKKEEVVFTHRKSPDGADITRQSSITPTSMFLGVQGDDLFQTLFKDEFPDRYLAKLSQLTR